MEGSRERNMKGERGREKHTEIKREGKGEIYIQRSGRKGTER